MSHSGNTAHQRTHPPAHEGPTAPTAVVVAMLVTEAVLAAVLIRGPLWLAVPLVLLVAHWMHGLLNAFHEASHGLLLRNRLLNDAAGTLIGLFTFMSLTLCRAAHRTHHIRLATEPTDETLIFADTGRLSSVAGAISQEIIARRQARPALISRAFLRIRRLRGQPWFRRRAGRENRDRGTSR
jgi:fatty acid desaturase